MMKYEKSSLNPVNPLYPINPVILSPNYFHSCLCLTCVNARGIGG
jgi:hypothetical protein